MPVFVTDVRILSPKRNLGYRSFFSHIVDMLTSSFKLYFYSNEAHSTNSGVRLYLEFCCVIVIKNVAFFTICAKLTQAFTFTSLRSNLYTLYGMESNFDPLYLSGIAIQR